MNVEEFLNKRYEFAIDLGNNVTRFRRFLLSPRKSTYWNINGSPPIAEENIIIKNGEVIKQNYWSAIIGEKSDNIPLYSLEKNGYVLTEVKLDISRSVLVKDFYHTTAGKYMSYFGEMEYSLFDYDLLKYGMPKEVHPLLLKFKNGEEYDVIQFAEKELLLYLFPNIHVVGMYTNAELKEMGLMQVRPPDNLRY